jgi:hypothetical protein
MRAWANRTGLPSGRRFDNATGDHSEVMSEHDKRIMAQVTGPMQAASSRCHQPAPGHDQLAERRYVFIPFWGGSGLPAVRDATRRFAIALSVHLRRYKPNFLVL